jgi:hypothetical protein
VYKGSKSLLAVILFFNLANLSLLSASVPGPEELLAGRPMWVVTVIAVQIAITLLLVGILSRSLRAETVRSWSEIKVGKRRSAFSDSDMRSNFPVIAMAKLSKEKLAALKHTFIEVGMSPGDAAKKAGVSYATAFRYSAPWERRR